MAVVDNEREKKRLRSYLNPAIRGPKTDAVLSSLATATSYLINSVNAVNASLYIATAQGQYLDLRLSEFGISRPPAVGLPDDVFREIGLEVKNRKQVRDLINKILDPIFGDEYVKATSSASIYEPYALEDGDTLQLSFDGKAAVTITFDANEFADIGAATAQEVASAVSASLNQLGLAGVAIEKSTGSNNYVELISGTIGPQSSIVVLGGRAQNVFKFPQPLPASGNFSTTWGITSQSGGVLRFTWIGGATPNLGKAEPGDYVNIFGGGFASSNYEGNFPLIDVAGGSMGESYFDILNPLATTGSVVQGLRDGLYDDVMLFYRPVKRTVSSNLSYAAIYQAVPRVLQIFLPATTRVVRRSREGSAHLHDAPQGTFLFNTQPNPGDIFGITASINLVAGTDFAIAANTPATIANMVGALNLQPGLVAEANSSVGGIIEDIDVVNIQNDSLDNQLTITYTGSADVIASGPQGENISLQPNQPGPYIYDTTQPFTVSSIHTTLSQTLNGSSSRVVTVSNSQAFPNAMGNLILDYGQTNQEIVPYLATPSNNTLLLSPAYTVQKTHLPGADVRFLESLAPPVLPADGSAFEFFLTSEVEGTAYAEALIQSVAAAGISVVFTILYSSDIGLGKWGSQYSEISYVYGPDSALP